MSPPTPPNRERTELRLLHLVRVPSRVPSEKAHLPGPAGPQAPRNRLSDPEAAVSARILVNEKLTAKQGNKVLVSLLEFEFRKYGTVLA